MEEKKIFARIILAYFAIMILGAYGIFKAFDFHEKKRIDSELAEASKSLLLEPKILLENSKEAMSFGGMKKFIETKDKLNIHSLIEGEREKKGNPLMLVVDKEGLVLTGTPPLSERGDYRLQITEWGIKLAGGLDVAAVVQDRFLPLVAIGGHSVFEENNFFGAIISARLLDGRYAISFKEEKLGSKDQIAFYSRKKGITGSSFGEEDNNILLSYFNNGLNISENNGFKIPSEVNIGGNYYSVRHLILPGLEESEGAALLFFNYGHFSKSLSISLFLVFVLLIFLFHCFYLEKNYFSGRSKYFVFLACAFIFLFGLVFFESVYVGKVFNIKDPIYLIYNSTLGFEPEYDILKLADSHRVAIKLSSGGEAINAAGVVVNFNPKEGRVEEIITENSFCQEDLFIEKSINNEKGEIRIFCGLPSPGFSKQEGVVAEIIFQPLKTGIFKLKFSEETQILANDGFGTDVLRKKENGSYFIMSGEEEKSDPVFVFSPSHPNSERWYNKKHVDFVWFGESQDCKYYFGKDVNATPDKDLPVGKSNISFDAEDDGVYFFSILLADKNLPERIIYKLMIDTALPDKPIVRVSDHEVERGEVVRLAFQSGDKLSGLQKNFYADFGTGLFLPINSPFYIPFMKAGDYKITIRVFDNAGNFNDSTTEIKVKNGLGWWYKNWAF